MPGRLAIDGGKPIRDTFLPYGKQSISDEDIKLVVEVLRSDWITTGPVLSEFEKKFAEHAGARYAVAVSSGTAALHLSMLAAGLKKGDEVITTPLSFVATANSVVFTGAIPRFCDVQPHYHNIDPAKITSLISDRTRAIVPVDFAGHPCDLREIREICDSEDLIMVQDACHSVSARYDGKRMGAHADMACFSFHPVKNMTTGEGGVVTTNDDRIYETLLSLRNHGINKDSTKRFGKSGGWYYEMKMLGYNYRMTDIQAALGLGQLSRLDDFHAKRLKIVAEYDRAIAEIDGLEIPRVKEDCEHGWHLYTILIDTDKFNAGRDGFYSALRAENIGVNIHYIPIHYHPFYRELLGDLKGSYPVAEDTFSRILTIPLFHDMKRQDIEDTVNALKKVADQYRR